MSSKEVVPTVAKRNDPAAYEPYAKSEATKALGQDPDFRYQWVRPDQVEAKCRAHEIGDERTGFLMVGPWQVVTKSEGLTLGRGPAAGSNHTDTTVTRGDLVLIKLHQAEHAKYAVIERKRDELITTRLTQGEGARLGKNTRIRTRVVGGHDGLDADVSADNTLGAA